MNVNVSNNITIEDEIYLRLNDAVSPSLIEVQNNSHLHLGHAGDNGTGQTHFQLTIVSDSFEGQSRVDRQRFVYASLDGLFEQGLHALQCQCYSEKEWLLKSGVVSR